MAKRLALLLIALSGAAEAGPSVAERFESGQAREAMWQCAGLFEAVAGGAAAGVSQSQRDYASRLSAAMSESAGSNAAQVAQHRATYEATLARIGGSAPLERPELAADLEACGLIAMSLAR